MSELYERIVSERGSFERLLARIPGFRGYLDLTARRAADRMLREHLVQRLDAQLRRLADAQRRLLNQEGGLARMSEVENARAQWQMYRDRLAAAEPGYSGFFAIDKIDALDLEKIYSFDEAQSRYVDQFAEAVAAIESTLTAGEPVDGAISQLRAVGVEANEALRLRETLLSGLSAKSE